MPVDAGDIGEEIKRAVFFVAQQGAGFANRPAFDINREFFAIELGAFDRGGVPGEQAGERRMILQLINFSDGGGEGHLPSTPLPCRVAPVQNSLFPNVEEPHQDDADIDQHLPKPEHLQLPQDDSPGIQKDGFHVEQDE